MSAISLTPADPDRCQAEIRAFSFMTPGSLSWRRCTNRPHWLARESVPAADGLIGAMTLCDGCAMLFVETKSSVVAAASYTLDWLCDEVWRTKDGRTLLLAEMSEDHLRRALRMILRAARNHKARKERIDQFLQEAEEARGEDAKWGSS